MKKIVFYIVVFSLSLVVYAQETLPLSVRLKNELNESSWVKETPFEKVEMTGVGHQISVFNVNPLQIAELMVAPKSGGLWFSDNGGETFRSIFENQPTNAIEALTVDWKNRTIAVGTPVGLFVSPDFGATWQFAGLASVKRISAIVMNPDNPKEIVVGALGDSFQPDEKRGVFKTTNGGESWQQKFFPGTQAGISQITVTKNPKVLYASVWENNQSPWEEKPYGKQSAIYKSENGGDSWQKITLNNGFASGNYIGKIGLTAVDENQLYAVVDNRTPVVPKADYSVEKKARFLLTEDDFSGMSSSEFLALDDNKLNVLLHTRGLGEKYTAQSLKQMVVAEINSPSSIATFIKLDSKTVVGAEIYRSVDGGKSWAKINTLTDVFYQNGNEFASISVHPTNSSELLLGGYPLLKSTDEGKSWKNIKSVSLHNGYDQTAFHPTQSNVIYATDNHGLWISYNSGTDWVLKTVGNSVSFDKMVIADKTLFASNTNGLWEKGKSQYPQQLNVLSTSNMAWSKNELIFAEDFGNFKSYNPKKGTITELGTLYNFEKEPLRFNRKAPVIVSAQNADILYAGSNKLHISLDRGKNWRTISEDVTNGDKNGNIAYGTLTTISESPFLFGLIYTGSDDGMIYVTKNGGVSWDLVYNAFPQPLEVSDIVASKHHRNRVLASLNATDANNKKAHVFLSDDYGKTWADISANLPEGRITVIKEDPNNEELLYVGSESGLYVSFDLGENWQPFVKDIPQGKVSDIAIDEDNTLWVSFAGYGIFKTGISELQGLRAAILAQDFYPLDNAYRVSYSPLWGDGWSEWATAQTPELVFEAFAGKPDVAITINIKKESVTLQTITHQTIEGFNYIPYDLTISNVGKVMYEKKLQKLVLTKATDGNIYLPKGKYTVEFTGKGIAEERDLIVE